MIKWIKIVTINLLIICALVLGVEVVVRVVYPEIQSQGTERELVQNARYGRTHGLKPNHIGTAWGATVVTDERGFRVAPDVDHRTDSRWILVLGDSITMAIGVDAASSYPHIIDKQLDNVGVINAAVVGHNFTDYLQVLNHTSNLDYDYIFIGMAINDVIETPLRAMRDQSPQYRQPSRFAFEWFFRRMHYLNTFFNFNQYLKVYSRAYLWIVSLVTDKSRNFFMSHYSYFEDTSDTEAINNFFSALAKIRAIQQKPIYLAIFPYEYQLRNHDFKYRLPQRSISEAAENYEFLVFDFYEPLLEYITENDIESKNLFLFNDPMHFSALGNRVIADIVITREFFRPILGAQ